MSSGSKTSIDLQSESGALSLSFALFLALLTSLGMGLWGLLRLEGKAQNLQLQVLECTAARVKKLKEFQNDMESWNDKIAIARKAVAASLVLAIEAQGPIRKALQTLVVAQDARQKQYLIESKTWRFWSQCRPLPLATQSTGSLQPEWLRPPSDALGPLPLQNQYSAQEAYRVSIRSFTWGLVRTGAAEVAPADPSFFDSDDPWIARWLPRPAIAL
jgi:hypothetical protein